MKSGSGWTRTTGVYHKGLDLQSSAIATMRHFQCAPDGIRTHRIQILSLTRLPVTSQAQWCPRQDSNLQTPDPKSGAYTISTTRAENKKASDFSEACICKVKQNQFDTIQPRSPDRYNNELYSEDIFMTQI
jgi:hypothetical protein